MLLRSLFGYIYHIANLRRGSVFKKIRTGRFWIAVFPLSLPHSQFNSSIFLQSVEILPAEFSSNRCHIQKEIDIIRQYSDLPTSSSVDSAVSCTSHYWSPIFSHLNAKYGRFIQICSLFRKLFNQINSNLTKIIRSLEKDLLHQKCWL